MNESPLRLWTDFGASLGGGHLLSAIESLPQPAWIFDRSGRYLAQSRIDRETHGDLVGLLPTEAGVGPEEGKTWLDYHLRVIAGEDFHYTRELETSIGLIHSETFIAPLRHDGRIIGGIGISVDQTKRVEAERAMERAREQLLAFLRISSDWAWETDTDHRFTLVLGHGERMGLDFSSWIGKTRWDLVGADPEQDPLWLSYRRLVDAHEPVSDFVYPLATHDGRAFWIEVNALPMRDAEGRFLGYRGVSRNVTDRERLLQMLRRSDLVIRATGNVILLTDADGRIEWANPAFTQFSGYTLDEAVGRTPFELLHCDETSPEAAREIREAMAAGREHQVRLVNRTRSGERHWVDVQLRPLHEANGRIAGFIRVQSVITDLVRTQERLRATIDGVAAGMLRFDAGGRIVECNPEACRLLAMDEQEILASSPDAPAWTMFDSDGARLAWDEIPAHVVLRTGQPIRDRVIGVRLPGGSMRWLRINARSVAAEAAGAGEVIMSFIDITGDEVQKRELDTARRLLHDVIETVPDAIAAFDREERLILCNEAYRQIYPLVADEIRIGARLEDVLRKAIAAGQFADSGMTGEEQELWLAARLAAHRSGNPAPFQQQLSDGRWLQLRETRSSAGVSVGVRSDITALRNAEIAIRRMAETDSLTGLADRTVVMREITDLCREHDRDGGQSLYVMMDLDRFKSINDTLGHDGGDQLLCIIANRLRHNTGKDDVVARLGGDEFAVLLKHVPDATTGRNQIAKLHRMLTSRVGIGGRSFQPGVSMGVTRLPIDGPTPRDLIKNADIALYQTKARGRNGWTFFEQDMRAHYERGQILADRLRRAITRQGIGLAFAPMRDLSNGALVGLEALPRLQRDDDPLSADALLAAAEEAGLGQRLAECVLDTACAELARVEPGGPVVSINLSRQPLSDPGFVETVRSCLDRYGVGGARLAFEIAEDALIDQDDGRIRATLAGLRDLGAGLVVDDFGKTSAALSTLRNALGASRIKLHPSFIARLEPKGLDAVIAGSVIDLAHRLGMQVIADGVSEACAAARLAELGCDIVQGPHAGPPRPHP